MIKSIMYFLGVLGGLILFIGCTNENSNQSKKVDYNLLSIEYCNCAAPSIDLNNQMRKLFERDQTEKIDQLAPTVSKAFKKAVICCKNAKDEQTQSLLDKKKLKNKLLESCPEMPSKLIQDLLTKTS